MPRGTAALAAQDALAEARSRAALIRMFLLGEAVGRSAAVQALAPLPLDDAVATGLVAGCTGDVAIGQLLDVLAVVHGLDRALLGPLVADVVEELVEVGILDTGDARPDRP